MKNKCFLTKIFFMYNCISPMCVKIIILIFKNLFQETKVHRSIFTYVPYGKQDKIYIRVEILYRIHPMSGHFCHCMLSNWFSHSQISRVCICNFRQILLELPRKILYPFFGVQVPDHRISFGTCLRAHVVSIRSAK